MNCLILEDEPHLGSAIELAAKKMGFATTRVTTLKEAKGAVAKNHFDLALLDRKVPDGDGLEFCKYLREDGFEGAVLILTAKGETSDRVAGLKSGADDYLPKPFSWEELSARIEAIMRRRPARKSGDAELWTVDKKRLRVRGKLGWVEMTPLEFKLAAHLIAFEGEIVSRDDLLRSVWGFSLLPKTRTVDLFIARLRKMFEENPEDPRHFLTIRGAGYRFQK